MANRRKRLEKKLDREREQKMLQELAMDLVEEGVPVGSSTGGVPSALTPLSFCITSHLQGTDTDREWPNRLGWLMHQVNYSAWAEEFYPAPI